MSGAKQDFALVKLAAKAAAVGSLHPVSITFRIWGRSKCLDVLLGRTTLHCGIQKQQWESCVSPAGGILVPRISES